MDDKQFWAIIESAGPAPDEPARQLAAVRAALRKLAPQEVRDFHRIFDERMGDAYTWDLWGAAYVINGGCSDDGFHAFRCWLIGMGREVYEKALANPDSLADVLTGEWPCEAELDAAPPRAWEEKTGRTDAEFYAELDRLNGARSEGDEGEDWDFDDDEEIRRRFPRLSGLYLQDEE